MDTVTEPLKKIITESISNYQLITNISNCEWVVSELKRFVHDLMMQQIMVGNAVTTAYCAGWLECLEFISTKIMEGIKNE